MTGSNELRLPARQGILQVPTSQDLRPQPRPPVLANPNPDEDRPAGWDWADLDDTEAAYLADALEEFVAFYNARYPWSREQTIPPCWSSHGALVEEITTLMYARWAAFQGPTASVEAAQTWHTYHLPLFISRINTWIGVEAAADCRTGHHQPSRLIDPNRPFVTGQRARPAGEMS